MITVGPSNHFGYHFEGGTMVRRPVHIGIVLDENKNITKEQP